MKLMISLLFFTTLLVSSQQLTLSQEVRLKSYTHKPSLSGVIDKRMTAMAQITRKEAKKIATNACGQDLYLTRLSHENRYLLYRLNGSHCTVMINALDGAILSMEQL